MQTPQCPVGNSARKGPPGKGLIQTLTALQSRSSLPRSREDESGPKARRQPQGSPGDLSLGLRTPFCHREPQSPVPGAWAGPGQPAVSLLGAASVPWSPGSLSHFLHSLQSTFTPVNRILPATLGAEGGVFLQSAPRRRELRNLRHATWPVSESGRTPGIQPASWPGPLLESRLLLSQEQPGWRGGGHRDSDVVTRAGPRAGERTPPLLLGFPLALPDQSPSETGEAAEVPLAGCRLDIVFCP